jgi:putative tryptophan/tyrosine transport system substrate-binding protein
MRRRELLRIIGGTLATSWSRTAPAQPRKLPTIGYLGVNPERWAPWTAAFVYRLNMLGWIDGKTVNLVFRWAHGRPELHTQFAKEFVELGVDVI